jgi:hypothetical protein
MLPMSNSDPLTDVLGYLLAFVGGFLVAGVGVWGSFMLARAEWKRSETRRLLDARRSTYVAYAREVKSEIRVCRQIGAKLGVAKSRAPLTREEGRAALAEISPRRSAELEDILLMGSEDVAQSARLWKYAQQQLEDYLLETTMPVESEYLRRYRKAGHARDQFYDAARKDLAVTGVIRLKSRAARETDYAALPEH